MNDVIAFPEHSQISPSDNYILEVVETKTKGSTYWSFQILARNKTVVYRSDDQFDNRHSTLILWDEADRVWVYSGDMGLFIWQKKQETQEWEKSEYSQTNLTPPDYLLKTKAFLFKK